VNAAYLILALPLAGSAVLLFGGRRTGDPLSGWIATVAAAGSFVATVVVWATLLGRSADDRTVDKNIFTWIPVGDMHVNFALQLDPLSVLWCLFVTGVGSLITLYAIGYMKGDSSYGRFFFYMNLFLFSMVVLVLADNFLFSFVGWEGVGFCSYALVGFWFERESAAVAAKKAFVTNRIGDFGFMIALFLMFGHFHSFNYSAVLAPLASGAQTLPGAFATGLALMLFLGAVGKSAQIPLYMWLPDAMEGPTPVSALIHAATMVTAGVYLVARSAPVLHFSPSAQWVVASIGAATALFAATIACAQDDIKRVLAYSTVSQLGYMFLGEGSGDYSAGIYHTVMHAFFKALLFLSAGAVIHGLHDEQDMKRMGGLWSFFRVTRWTYVIGALALAAIPPFDGFWSKDAILQAAYHKSLALWIIGVVTAGLTAYYMSRQIALVFAGQARWDEHASAHGAAGTPHEAPPVMTIPLIILAVASTIGWLLNAPFGGLDFINKWLAPVFPTTIAPAYHLATGTKWIIGIIATATAFVGLAAGLRAWLPTYQRPKLEPAVVRHGWYIDEEVSATVSGPLTRWASALSFVVDARVVDGTVNGLARFVAATGRQGRRVQTGYLRNYALGIGIGAAVLLAFVAFRAVGGG
jgi:NADH-quinone oxidoreductase subunit L